LVLKVGVIGSSGHARNHALGYKQDARTKVLGIAAHAQLDRAKKLAEEVGAEIVTLDYHDLLKNSEIEAVSIVTPNYLHAKIAVEAAEAGKHILCEKPMAITVRECDEMISAARKAGVLLSVGFNYRLQVHFERTRYLLENHEVGRIVQAYALRLHPNPYPLHVPWRTKRTTMGGLVLSMDSHDIDMLRWLIGEIKSVKAEMKRLVYDEIDYEDNGWLIFSFENGAIGSLGSSMSCYMNVYEYLVLGTDGTIRIYPHEKTVVLKKKDKETREALKEEVHSVHREIGLFIDSIEKGEIMKPLASGQDGRTVNHIVESVHRSVETGSAVAI